VGASRRLRKVDGGSIERLRDLLSRRDGGTHLPLHAPCIRCAACLANPAALAPGWQLPCHFRGGTSDGPNRS
jgi:hypothetical protein